jgi:hypothetical protein
MKYIVLKMLLNSPTFDLKTYSEKDAPALTPPTPVDQLLSGPDHITLQYLLSMVDIPEVSYEDNSRLINEWLSQLGSTQWWRKSNLPPRRLSPGSAINSLLTTSAASLCYEILLMLPDTFISKQQLIVTRVLVTDFSMT